MEKWWIPGLGLGKHTMNREHLTGPEKKSDGDTSKGCRNQLEGDSLARSKKFWLKKTPWEEIITYEIKKLHESIISITR